MELPLLLLLFSTDSTGMVAVSFGGGVTPRRLGGWRTYLIVGCSVPLTSLTPQFLGPSVSLKT